MMMTTYFGFHYGGVSTNSPSAMAPKRPPSNEQRENEEDRSFQFQMERFSSQKPRLPITESLLFSKDWHEIPACAKTTARSDRTFDRLLGCSRHCHISSQ